MRLDGELTKSEYPEKKGAMEVEQATVVRRPDLVQPVISQGEDDLERALAVVNRLPELWAKADEEGRRDLLEAVFVRFVVEEKRVVEVEVRPPYRWVTTTLPNDADRAAVLVGGQAPLYH